MRFWLCKFGLLIFIKNAFIFSIPIESFLPECKKSSGLARELCLKEWAVVIYIAADNDLGPYSYRDLFEMESVGTTADVDVIVYHDSHLDDGSRYYLIEKHDFKYQESLKNFVVQNKLSQLSAREQEEAYLTEEGSRLVHTKPLIITSEEDSGDILVAGKFLRWAFQKFPSKRVMLIGSSHGEGFDAALERTWYGNFKLGRLGGFAFDFQSGSHMRSTEMALGLGKILKEVRNGKRIDIAGSDACLNQQVEFGYEWNETVDYVFGSSSIVQKKGFNFRSLLRWITQNPQKETADLAKMIPALYGASIKAKTDNGFLSYHDPKGTMSVWNLFELRSLILSLDDLGNLLTNWIHEKEDDLSVIIRTQEIKKIILASLYLGGVSNDLMSFFQNLESWLRSLLVQDPENKGLNKLKKSLEVAQLNLNKAVLSKYVGEGYQESAILTSKAVGIYLPNYEQEAREMLPKLKQSQFYQLAPHWQKFIEGVSN